MVMLKHLIQILMCQNGIPTQLGVCQFNHMRIDKSFLASQNIINLCKESIKKVFYNHKGINAKVVFSCDCLKKKIKRTIYK